MNGNKIRPPFGVKVTRFSDLGYHPGWEVRPGTFKNSKIFPGCYEWNKSKKIVSKVPRWKRQEETEEFSRRLGYHGDDKIKLTKWLKSVNGPGWQDVPSFSLKRDISFPKAVRFPAAKFKSFSVPGPGTYGENHVPHTNLEKKSHAKGFSFSTVLPFEQSSHAPRSFGTEQSYHLPPNLYKIKSFTDEIESKQISKRGPYDLFTGERFSDTVVTKSSILFQRINPSDLSHPKNAFKVLYVCLDSVVLRNYKKMKSSVVDDDSGNIGKFQRCGKESILTSRLALTNLALTKKNVEDPGPNHYDPYPIPAVTQSRAPFNSSVLEARPVVKWGPSPPPGRYNTEIKRRILGDGMKSAFLSKVDRKLPLAEKNSWFE